MKVTYPLTLLYDAACPVCSLEMDHLRERDHDGKLRFVNIAEPGFDPTPYGATLAEMNAEIRGLLADGELIHGVQVLRLAYEAVGLGWVLRPTAWPPLRAASNAGYRYFARHRKGISRVAGPVINRLRAHRAQHVAAQVSECAHGQCAAKNHH